MEGPSSAASPPKDYDQDILVYACREILTIRRELSVRAFQNSEVRSVLMINGSLYRYGGGETADYGLPSIAPAEKGCARSRSFHPEDEYCFSTPPLISPLSCTITIFISVAWARSPNVYHEDSAAKFDEKLTHA